MTNEIHGLYDVAEHLNTEDRIAAYLKACTEDGADSARIAQALSVVARARTINELARDTGLRHEVLHKMYGDPSFATVMKAAVDMGFEMIFRRV